MKSNNERMDTDLRQPDNSDYSNDHSDTTVGQEGTTSLPKAEPPAYVRTTFTILNTDHPDSDALEPDEHERLLQALVRHRQEMDRLLYQKKADLSVIARPDNTADTDSYVEVPFEHSPPGLRHDPASYFETPSTSEPTQLTHATEPVTDVVPLSKLDRLTAVSDRPEAQKLIERLEAGRPVSEYMIAHVLSLADSNTPFSDSNLPERKSHEVKKNILLQGPQNEPNGLIEQGKSMLFRLIQYIPILRDRVKAQSGQSESNSFEIKNKDMKHIQSQADPNM